jgi:hypothetical protein
VNAITNVTEKDKKMKRVVATTKPLPPHLIAVWGLMKEREGRLEEPLLLHQLQTLGEPLLTSIRGKYRKQGSQNIVWSPGEHQNLSKWKLSEAEWKSARAGLKSLCSSTISRTSPHICKGEKHETRKKERKKERLFIFSTTAYIISHRIL